jgi:hypothetical protein
MNKRLAEPVSKHCRVKGDRSGEGKDSFPWPRYTEGGCDGETAHAAGSPSSRDVEGKGGR